MAEVNDKLESLTVVKRNGKKVNFDATRIALAIKKEPTIIDNDRTLRGDYYKKPTAYWYFNCEPTYGKSYQPRPKSEQKSIIWQKSSGQKGLCSEDRSMISPDYARNFICDFILGKEQEYSERSLFEE